MTMRHALTNAPLHRRECRNPECSRFGLGNYDDLHLTYHVRCNACGVTMNQPSQHHDHETECA